MADHHHLPKCQSEIKLTESLAGLIEARVGILGQRSTA